MLLLSLGVELLNVSEATNHYNLHRGIYMLFVNYVLDLNNGFRAKVVVEESKDIYLEYMDY